MRILTINGGSSSVKFALFSGTGTARFRELGGKIDHIGLPKATLTMTSSDGGHTTEDIGETDMSSAIKLLLVRLDARGALSDLGAVAHRVVHGAHFKDHVRITDAVKAELARMVPYDPEHLPAELALVEACSMRVSTVPQIACFDTVFHRSIPESVALLPIPRIYGARGVRRYGFHGLSYVYLRDALRTRAGEALADGRVVMAHLGNGASLCALKGGVSVDTTMAFSPNSGIPMGTRSGDIDPGVIRYLNTEGKLSLADIDILLTTKSGLKGMSETTYDMEALLTREQDDARAHETIEAFCYAVRKQIGAYAAALGGLDALVFSGGMGAASAPIRRRVSEGLEFLGVSLDEEKNTKGEGLISAGRTAVWALSTDEEAYMAEIAEGFITK